MGQAKVPVPTTDGFLKKRAKDIILPRGNTQVSYVCMFVTWMYVCMDGCTICIHVHVSASVRHNKPFLPFMLVATQMIYFI